MSERYIKLFSQSEPLYAEGSPVIIAAGALLLDNVVGKVLAQLKFKSVSSKTVKAVTVSITAKDTVGRAIGKPTLHQYLDLNALRDEEFGQKTAIFLPSESTREYGVRVTEAVFADNSVWTAPDDLPWQPVPKQEPLFPDDAELLKQYRIDVNPIAKYEPIVEKGLWLCACGAVNRAEESTCHSCEASLSAMKNADLDKLREDCSNRLAEERKADEARRIDAEKAAKKRKKIAAIAAPIACAIIAFIIVMTTVIIPNGKYNAAVELGNAGKYDEAISAFTALNGYKDSKKQIENCKYNAAVELYNAGNIVEAYDAFIELDGYKDSAERASDIYPTVRIIRIIRANVGVWDTVYFGAYEQDNDSANGKEDIEWLVLAREDNKVLIISKGALERKPYNTTDTDVTWETCSLREWLNNDFLNSAFSPEEQTMIQSTRISADKDPDNDSIYQGNATTDKIFLLSKKEAEEYFDLSEGRKGYPTKYARRGENSGGSCLWWLRTNTTSWGGDGTAVCVVEERGLISKEKCLNDLYIRPALRIDLEATGYTGK